MKKYLVIIIPIICIILAFSCFALYSINKNREYENKRNAELIKEKNNIFKIDKIVAYSGASAKNNVNDQHAYWDLSIYQFTDFAVYIGVNSDKDVNETDIKKIFIDDLKIDRMSSEGNALFNILHLKDMGKAELDDEIKGVNKIEFSVVQNFSGDNLEFKKDCSIPLTFRYLNNEITDSRIIQNIDSPLKFDASILKRANISISSLICNISFVVRIINELDEAFEAKVSLELPINEELYKGSQTVNLDNDINFTFMPTPADR